MTAETTHFPPQDAPTTAFPYRIEAKVGLGSMGIVYRAIDTDLERPVAIKALRNSLLEDEPEALREDIKRRFQQEARAAAALAHPAVTAVYRVGESGGTPYIVMEWLEGITLERMLTERGRLGPREAAQYTVELLEALEFAHRRGIVHRDIKPSNLLILEADGRLKVTDFGIALVRGRELVKTRDGLVLATPKFASPEQLAGTDIDGRADLFAVGILLYALLSGSYPFQGSSFMELANAIMTRDPEPLRSLDSRIPPALEAVVRRALMKERDDRYASAAAMAEPLRAWLAERSGASSPRRGDVVTDVETAWQMPIRRELPHDPALAVLRVVESWPARELARQRTDSVIDRLLEKPLHAPPFAGATMIGSICLLVEGGRLLGAIDTVSGEHGDAVIERLPERAAARLYPVPAMLPGRVLSLLATLLWPPAVRLGDLDSSFVNLPALASKLTGERFDGILRLRHGQDLGFILFDRGNAILNLYSTGWKDVPIDESWQRWVADVEVLASVEDKVVRPLASWYRRAFRGRRFAVAFFEQAASSDEPERTSSSRIRQLVASPRSGALPIAAAVRITRVSAAEAVIDDGNAGYEQAPAYRFLDFMLRSLPGYLAERSRTGAWKYLHDWLYLVREATLYPDLVRPASDQRDRFDLVTTDSEGKLLHVADHLPTATAKSLEAFLERVEAAKSARYKTGDVGGAFLLAERFTPECLDAYRTRVAERSSSFFGLDEQLTGYAGFVRMSARRGFHLMLVEARDDGFEPQLT